MAVDDLSFFLCFKMGAGRAKQTHGDVPQLRLDGVMMPPQKIDNNQNPLVN